MMRPKRIVKRAVPGCMVALLFSCAMPGHEDTATGDGARCVSSEFLENGPYVLDPSQGIPFPFLRHSFCTLDDENRVRYSFEMSDAHKKVVHAVFTLEFSDFAVTADGATATYERSTFRAITEFAEGNALSKWLSCRDLIESRKEFEIDRCTEVHGDDVRHVRAGDPGGQPEADFPCGITVGPDDVRHHEGATVPDTVYPGTRKYLTEGFTRGQRHELKTDRRIEGVYVPAGFFGSLTFATALSECGG